jgi:membrane-associated protein
MIVLLTQVPMLLPSWLDPEKLIMLFGPWALWGVAFVVFAECGLFAILPGDSLLFTVGLFVSLGTIHQQLWFVCSVLTVAAVLGNAVGYGLGRVVGPPLFKPRSGLLGRILKKSHLDQAHDFIERYGNRALIMARFVPIVRTFVTLVAGVGRMGFGRFIGYTAIGGVLWACGVTVLGFYLGRVPLIHDNIELALILIVVVSVTPMVIELIRRRSIPRP